MFKTACCGKQERKEKIMKSLKYIGIAVLAGVGLLAASCDTIEEGDRKHEYTGPISSERMILLEDYTGVKCINCPTAAAEITRLQEFYGDNLIVVGVYPLLPDGLTKPYDPSRDLRTDVAQTWASAFAIEQFPMGMVNRQEVTGYAEWGGSIAEIISEGLNYVNLSVSASLPTDTTIAVNVEGSFVEDYEADGAVNMITMILEDSIVAPQLTGSGVNGGYVHNHVLRAVIGPEWGSQVASEAPARGTAFSASLTGSVNSGWRKNKLSVVVAIVNASSHEVIQAGIVHLGEE